MSLRGLAVPALLGTIVSLALVDAAAAATASFDCAIANAPIEKIICGDDDLAAFDVELNHAYSQRRRGLRREELAELRREQQQWLRSRLSGCNVPATPDAEPPDDVVECLSDLYRQRIEELQAATPQPSETPAAAAPVTEAPTDGVDRDEKVFSVDRAGRYAIRLESKTGAALQVIDRMAGPSPLAGEIGKQDGRLDLLLDRGSYKAVMLTPEGSADHPGLRVDPFQELNGANLPRLVELKPASSDLDDLTQRSWWIEITERRDVAIEAAGRHLADLRLWKDGNWLMDAAPAETVVESEPGRPLAVRQLATTLEPGLYLLTAYGGPGVPWSKGSDAKPFYLRFGIPVLAEAAQRRMVASPMGVDRYLVPKPANVFRLQLDAPDTAALTVGPFNPSAPFATGGSRGEIAKNSRVPAAEVSAWASRDFQLVTVERQAGQPYLLQNFHGAQFFAVKGGGDFWIEAIHAATSDDDPDLTGVLTETTDDRTRIVASSAIEVGPNKAWQRHFNLLDRVTLYVSISAAGGYRVSAEGENVDAELRFEPVGPQPSNYRTPAFERGDHVWTLERGIYLLTLAPRPEKKGIATVTVMPSDYAGAIKPASRLAVVAMRSQRLSADFDYDLYLGELPGMSSGLVLRQLPIDLATDLPMTLKPHERVDIATTLVAGGEGTLAATAEDGKAIAVAVDGAPPAPSTHLRAGAHRIVIANAEDHALPLTLHIDRDALQPEAPLPLMSAERLKALPDFPVLTPDKPAFFDLARSQQRSVNIAVAAPALYRLETGGLLATQGNLRTRMVTSLARAEANGVGRNFLIQNYLREGDYQISLAPTGASAGHLSLALTAAPIADRGALSFGIPSRATLSPGSGVRYDFRIDRKATYHLTAFGLNRTFPIRVEDADGWPVGEPIVDGEISRVFLPGLYRVTLLPGAVECRSLTLIEEVKPPVTYEGHGPHDLPFDNEVANEWLEPAAGGARVPDGWRFSLPAAADITLTIGEGMIGTLMRQDTVVADLLRGPTWQGNLSAGDYRLEMRSIRPNNHLPYTLTLHSDQMLVGQSREVKAPAEIAIALGGNDLVEISSFGNADVRARLYDAENRLIAANDDRANDWNFDIAASLAAGRYRLKVDPVGTDKATTRVDLFRPEEKSEPPLAVPGTAATSDAALHTYPLTVTGAGLLVIAAQSHEATSLALERMAADKTWRSVGLSGGAAPLVAVPVTADDAGNYRLRVWSTDRKPAEITVVTRLAAPTPASESDLAHGVTPTAVAGIEPPLFVAAATPAQPGVLHLEDADEHLLWSSAAGAAVAGDASGVVIAGQAPVWLLDRSAAPRRLHATRVDFDVATRLVLPPGPSAIALAPKPGRGPQLWQAQSRFGQPGIVVGDIADAAGSMGVAENSNVALAGAGGGTLRLWNGSDMTEALQFTLHRIDFAAPQSETLAAGALDVTLGTKAARLFKLGDGMKRFHLLLPPGTAAVLRHGDTPLATFWTDQASRSYTAELAADSLLLLHAGDGAAQATIIWNALKSAPAPLLTQEKLFKRYDGAAGVLRLDVAPRVGANVVAPSKLRVYGTPAEASFVGADGRVTRGHDLALSGPGTLLIDHGPGLVAAWLENAVAPDQAIALELDGSPRIVKLAGDAMRFTLAPKAPVLLSVRTTAPVIATVVAPDGNAVTEAFAEGGRLTRYLPAGSASIALQSAAEGPLAGDAEFVETPVTPMDEGLGETVQLGAGETRLYGFTLAQEQTIGVGLRASVDIAQCRLLDAGGKTLGTGIVEMHDLPAGSYVMAVTAPADTAPIEIRPALVGLRRPDTGPPDDVKRQYLQLVGRLPSD